MNSFNDHSMAKKDKSSGSKSFSVLCKSFCELYQSSPQPIKLDVATECLESNRRSLSDVFQILSAIGLIKCAARGGIFQWKGYLSVLKTIHELKRRRSATAESPPNLRCRLKFQMDTSYDKKPSMMEILTQKLIQNLIDHDRSKLPLVLEDILPQISSCFGELTNEKSRAKRLQDVANVMCTLNLIERHVKTRKKSKYHRGTKIRSYSWTGPEFTCTNKSCCLESLDSLNLASISDLDMLSASAFLNKKIVKWNPFLKKNINNISCLPEENEKEENPGDTSTSASDDSATEAEKINIAVENNSEALLKEKSRLQQQLKDSCIRQQKMSYILSCQLNEICKLRLQRFDGCNLDKSCRNVSPYSPVVDPVKIKIENDHKMDNNTNHLISPIVFPSSFSSPSTSGQYLRFDSSFGELSAASEPFNRQYDNFSETIEFNHENRKVGTRVRKKSRIGPAIPDFTSET